MKKSKSVPSILGGFLLIFASAISDSFQEPIDLECNFANKNCAWTGLDQGWQWVKPTVNRLQIDGPLKRSGRVNSASDNILYANVSSISGPISLTSPYFKLDQEACFSFWFNSVIDPNTSENEEESGRISLVLERLNSTDEEEVWYHGGAHRDMWQNAQVQLSNQTAQTRLKLKASGASGFVALQPQNHFELTPGQCNQTLCDFESGWCGWTSAGGTPANYVFRREKASQTKQFHTDHTSQQPGGHALFLSTKHSANHVSRYLLSPFKVRGQTQYCLSLWFQISKQPEAQFILYSSQNPTDVQLWRSYGSLTYLPNEWTQVRAPIFLDLPHTTESQLKMWVIVDTTIDHKNVTVDDIQLSEGDCSAIASCNFKHDICSWKDSEHTNLRWSLGHGRVRDASKLKFAETETLDSVFLYTDFTRQQGAMELLSEFVKIAELEKSKSYCVLLIYDVTNFNHSSDTFELTQIMPIQSKKEKIIWKYDLEHDEAPLASVLIPVSIINVYSEYFHQLRFALRASSQHASTFIRVHAIDYTTLCASEPPAPSAVPQMAHIGEQLRQYEAGKQQLDLAQLADYVRQHKPAIGELHQSLQRQILALPISSFKQRLLLELDLARVAKIDALIEEFYGQIQCYLERVVCTTVRQHYSEDATESLLVEIKTQTELGARSLLTSHITETDWLIQKLLTNQAAVLQTAKVLFDQKFEQILTIAQAAIEQLEPALKQVTVDLALKGKVLREESRYWAESELEWLHFVVSFVTGYQKQFHDLVNF